MLISIIVPIYNTEKYLHDCIDSIIRQTYMEIEIILINDGSTDNSGNICDEYAKKYPNIKVIHQENMGQFASRFIGMKEATGEYYVFLDSDDMLRKDAIQIIVDKVSASNCDLLVFEGSRDEDFSSLYMNIPLKNDKVYSKKELNEIYALAVGTGKLNCMCMKAFRANIFNVNCDYLEFYNMRNGEDTLMALMVINASKTIYYISDVLYYYRTNQNSVSFKYNKHIYEDRKKVELKRREYSTQWFGGIIEGVYNRNLNVCFDSIMYEITSNPNGIISKIKKVREILRDDFFITSYKSAEKTSLCVKKRMIMFFLIYFKMSFVLILLYNIKKSIKGRISV